MYQGARHMALKMEDEAGDKVELDMDKDKPSKDKESGGPRLLFLGIKSTA